MFHEQKKSFKSTATQKCPEKVSHKLGQLLFPLSIQRKNVRDDSPPQCKVI
jgi:hypothetical protein